MDFSHEQLPNIYKGVRIGKATIGTCYIFSNNQGDFMEIYVHGVNEWRFVIDNYPRQRKFYSTNLPYRNIEDFESDLNRIGVQLMKNK